MLPGGACTSRGVRHEIVHTGTQRTRPLEEYMNHAEADTNTTTAHYIRAELMYTITLANIALSSSDTIVPGTIRRPARCRTIASRRNLQIRGLGSINNALVQLPALWHLLGHLAGLQQVLLRASASTMPSTRNSTRNPQQTPRSEIRSRRAVCDYADSVDGLIT